MQHIYCTAIKKRMTKNNLPVKLLLFSIIVLFGVLILANFASATGLAVLTPTNETNFTKTNVLFNISYTNATNITTPISMTIWARLNGAGDMINITSRLADCGPNYCSTRMNFTSFADGNYSINATLHNGTDSASIIALGNFTRSVRFDQTPPNVSSLELPIQNGQNYTGVINFNVSVVDSMFNITNVYFNITNITGTQVDMANATQFGNYWNASLNTNLLTDGVFNITVYANDTLNNLNSSMIVYTVRFDKTIPGISSFSCTPNPVQSGSTITCSCVGTDATSGVNATTYTVNPSTSDTGSISTSCTVVDKIGLSATATIQYSVNQAPGNTGSSGGSGGGGSTVTPSKKVVNTLDKITPGSAAIVKNFDKDYGLKEISIEVNNPAQSVSVSISKYDGKPAEVSVEKSGDVYKYLQIKVDNIQDKLSKATVRIQVEKSWANGKSLTKDKISMFKFINNGWKELPTTFKEEDATNYYYDVELLSFSFFAIGEKAQEQAVTPEEATTVSEPTAPAETGGKSAAATGVIIAIVVIIIIIGAVIFFMYKKKKLW